MPSVRHHRRRLVAGLVSLAVGVALAVPVAAGQFGSLSGDRALVGTQAQRGVSLQVTDTVPAPPPPPARCQRLVVIGDSLTEGTQAGLDAGLRASGIEPYVDAQRGRRIPESVGEPYSGVKAALAARLAFGEADCWVIALGTNDLIHGAFKPSLVDAWITGMLAAVTPGAQVWWVNVDYHASSVSSFDFPAASVAFNSRLDLRASFEATFDVIDWYGLAEANLQWFVDPVHVTWAGYAARVQQTVDAVTQPR